LFLLGNSQVVDRGCGLAENRNTSQKFLNTLPQLDRVLRHDEHYAANQQGQRNDFIHKPMNNKRAIKPPCG
jgi:hypothetical protein